MKSDARMEISKGNADHLAWAASVVRAEDWPWGDDACCLAIQSGEKLRAVIVFDHFTKTSCCAHIATDGTRSWATRGMLFGMFSLPFLSANVRCVTLPIAERNIPAQILALKLGFKWEGRRFGALRDDNQLIFGMQKDDCIWIREEQGHG